MKTSHTLRALSLSTAAIAVLAAVIEAAASNVPPPVVVKAPPAVASTSGVGLKKGLEMMATRRPAEAGDLPRNAKANSGVVGELDAGVMSASEVSLTLADGNIITARLQRVSSDSKHNAQTWLGTFDDSPGSVLVMSKAAGTVSGYANYDGQTLEILPGAAGKHVLFAVDSSKLPKSDGVIKFDSSGGNVLTTTGTSDAGTSTTLAAGSTVVQDLLVVYTAAAANTWGKATLEGMIQSAVQSANQAYVNSQVGINLNLVGLQQVAMTESGSGMQATLSSLKSNGEVRSLRDNLAADMVVLVSQDADWCGYANLTISSSNTDAYAVAASDCLSNQTLAHEVGHLQGLDHDRANSTGSSAFYPYSYGYRMCTTGGFRDIMAYSCSGATLLLQFSNPNLSYNGYPTGISYEANPSNAADAARSLNASATQVAAYRTGTSTSPTPTAPAAPSGLSASSIAYNKVVLAWADNATNESGYKVERSSDGATFIEVANLSTNASTYSDTSVATSSNYSYRVRAFNSVGFSGYSNTISVRTPVSPPPPPASPSNLGAVNQGNGSASVSWSGGSGATNFEVRRETWDSRKKAWGRSTVAATVPSSVLSIIDSAGSGTYRYFVRAINSTGSSGEAGPAPVDVTGGTITSVIRGKKTR